LTSHKFVEFSIVWPFFAIEIIDNVKMIGQINGPLLTPCVGRLLLIYSTTLIGEIFARLILAYISESKNLDIFWIYFSESQFQKILRGLILANRHFRTFCVD